MIMERKLVIEIKEGEHAKLAGWVHEIRDLAKMKFILLRDTTGLVQCIIKDEALLKAASVITLESVIEIEGAVNKANVKAELARKDVEVHIKELRILSKAETLPIQVNEKTITTELPTRLDWRFIDTRKPRVNAIFKTRSSFYKHAVDFFDGQGFTIINTPKITTIGLESGAESFVVDYFGKKAVLAQSPQFYKQMFTVAGFERVMEIGAVYRAEKSHTTRHLTEFIGLDFEMAFIKDENDVMDVIESMLKHVIEGVRKDRTKELEVLGVQLKTPKKIPRVDMAELKKLLAKKGKKLSEDDDLDAEAEKMVGEYALEEYGEEFIFVTNYPASVRPFYHMRPEKNSRGTRSFDLLWKGVEIATGAQREHRLEILQKQAKEKGITMPKIYEDIFRYGCPPHGGVGLGLDRIVQRMLNLENVREALLLTRDPERVTP
jgi:nondiscriminating aspartyl-tRNA synthetase